MGMSSSMTGIAGASIARGDGLKLVDGKLFPALSNEQTVGAAGEAIAAGEEMVCGSKGHWTAAPPKQRNNS
jgi:hypothetical protein